MPRQASAALEVLTRSHSWQSHEKAAMIAIFESADAFALAARG